MFKTNTFSNSKQIRLVYIALFFSTIFQRSSRKCVLIVRKNYKILRKIYIDVFGIHNNPPLKIRLILENMAQLNPSLSIHSFHSLHVGFMNALNSIAMPCFCSAFEQPEKVLKSNWHDALNLNKMLYWTSFIVFFPSLL